MDMRSTVRHCILFTVIAGCVVAAWPSTTIAQPNTIDARQRLALPVEQRVGVLAEMRLMLKAVSGVVDGLSRGDSQAASEAARSAGAAAAVDAEPQLQALLPARFLALGTTTHKKFDNLADKIAAGVTTRQALSDLARITNNCTTCHATYRIDEAR